jgi:quercetin dioxygenase-like cupin family protein
VKAAVARSDAALVVVFTFRKDMTLPPHAHGAQSGTVIATKANFTFGGKIRACRPGDGWLIPAGVEHGAIIKAGTRVIDAFQAAGRHPLISTTSG